MEIIFVFSFKFSLKIVFYNLQYLIPKEMNWQNFVIGSTYYVDASNYQPNLYQFVPQLHYNEQLLNQFQIFIV